MGFLVASFFVLVDVAWTLVKWIGGFMIALLLLSKMGWIAWEQTPATPCPPCPEALERDPLGILDD